MADKKIGGGYIMLARQLIESEIFQKPPLYLKVWIYLLARAQHDDYKKLKRGQLSTSIPEIQEAVSWKVGFRTETPSKDQIFRIINWLRNPNEACDDRNGDHNMIKTMKATHSMLVTISNYGVYQDSKNYERNAKDSTNATTKTSRPQRDRDNTNKNDKNVKNKDHENFELLWKLYPKKEGDKKRAERAYLKAIKDGVTNKEIQTGIVNYINKIKAEGIERKYIAQGATWFNQNRWTDEYEVAVTNTTTSDGQRQGKTTEEIEAERKKHEEEVTRRAEEKLKERDVQS